ncbi:hypothetical protein [Lentibacillus daqui]|uniref:hypothetical protein n=1 Tax=Lentibacillus daqui TaxID=2911514 RepID=UPI0022B08C51|nr:hypothetical protein [Lentibacillus daqui]
MAKELIKTEKGTNLLNKMDPKLTKKILNTLRTSGKFFQYARYAKYTGKYVGGLASFTFYFKKEKQLHMWNSICDSEETALWMLQEKHSRIL